MASIEYVRKDTPIHGLQAITKMLLVLASFAVSFFALDYLLLGLWIAFLIGWWVLGGIEIRRLGVILKVLLGTYLFFVLLQGFTYRFGNTELFRLGVLMVGSRNYAAYTLEGFLFGTLVFMRVLAVVFTLPILTMTTPMTKIAATLGKLKVPYQFTMIFVTGIRFVPLVFQTWTNVIQAQKLRGRDIDKMPIYRKAAVYTSVLTPLLLYLLKLSQTLQTALECRAFGSPAVRTYVEEAKLRVGDYVAIATIIVVAAALVIMKATGYSSLPYIMHAA
ncbi:MAG: energy-coupling factor transporter transmembrane component T [Candidatus Bathyarchaeia archaeon]